MEDDTLYDKVTLPNTDLAPKGGETPFFLIVLLLIFIPPAAWYVLWKDKDNHEWFGYLITIYGVIAVIGSIIAKFILLPQVHQFYASIHLQEPAVSPLSYLNVYIVLGILEIGLGITLIYIRRKHQNKLSENWLIVGLLGLIFTAFLQPLTQVYLTYTAFNNLVEQTKHTNNYPMYSLTISPTIAVITPTISQGNNSISAFSEKAVILLTENLGIKKDEITVVSATKKSWPDGSLGCPKPGMMYAQHVVDGYQIILEAKNKQYDYHAANSIDSIFLCEK